MPRYYVSRSLSHAANPDPLRWFIFDNKEVNRYVDNPGPRLIAICYVGDDVKRVMDALNFMEEHGSSECSLTKPKLKVVNVCDSCGKTSPGNTLAKFEHYNTCEYFDRF